MYLLMMDIKKRSVRSKMNHPPLQLTFLRRHSLYDEPPVLAKIKKATPLALGEALNEAVAFLSAAEGVLRGGVSVRCENNALDNNTRIFPTVYVSASQP
jgi:hypothetical protein